MFAAVVNAVNRTLADSSPPWKCLAGGESCHSRDTMNRIRELRHARRMSLVETARLAGTTVQQLSRLELGERRLTIDWMDRIAAALGVSPAELLPEAGKKVGEFVQSSIELNLLRFWRGLSAQEKLWLVAVASSYGYRLTNNDGPGTNQPKVRRA
jgi:transcriptional regulator with XRE-family HTH domain